MFTQKNSLLKFNKT